jgi:hypothetical protein
LQETSEFTNLALYMILTIQLHFYMHDEIRVLSPTSSLLLEIRIFF